MPDARRAPWFEEEETLNLQMSSSSAEDRGTRIVFPALEVTVHRSAPGVFVLSLGELGRTTTMTMMARMTMVIISGCRGGTSNNGLLPPLQVFDCVVRIVSHP